MPESSALRVEASSRGDAVVLVCVGEIDLMASPSLRNEIKAVQSKNPKRLIVDLAGVPYMDSSGVATLVEAMTGARRGGTGLVLCCMQDKVRSIFEIARLDTVFTIVDSVDAAMEA